MKYLIAMLLLCSCAPQRPNEIAVSHAVERFEDTEKGIVCYKYFDLAISCVKE